jgi:hypothetical protein
MIGESLSALVTALDREPVQQALGELKQARVSEARQIDLSLSEQGACLRLSNIMEDGACTGMLAILEAKSPPTQVPKGRRSA